MDNSDIKSIDQHKYDFDGQQKISKYIDEENKLSVKALSVEELKNGKIGYKAARTLNGKMCIVKLFLPNDSKIAWDQYKDKYRTDKAVVISIKPVYYNDKYYYYTNDFNIDECAICFDSQATHMAYPCRHKLCGGCWDALMKTAANKNCHYCRSTIDKIVELPIGQIPKDNNNDDFSKNDIMEAYSCIHTDNFVYRINEQVTIDDFDGSMNKVCAPGIHFHDEEKDVFKWFEYLDIPNNLLGDAVPWMGDNNIVVDSDDEPRNFSNSFVPSFDQDEIDDHVNTNLSGKKKI
jgi:hypothetical protein